MNRATYYFKLPISLMAIFLFQAPLICQEKVPESSHSSTRLIKNSDIEWARALNKQAMELAFELKPDPVANASWGINIIEGTRESPAAKIWIWIDSKGKLHVHYRTTLTFLSEQVQTLHKSYPTEEIEAICRRLHMVDADLDGADLNDLRLTEIANAMALIPPPSQTCLDSMNQSSPVDSWWEWEIKSSLPKVNYHGQGYRDAVAHCVEKYWQPPIGENGELYQGMSTIKEMNILTAWTDSLFYRCHEFWEKHRKQSQLTTETVLKP